MNFITLKTIKFNKPCVLYELYNFKNFITNIHVKQNNHQRSEGA